jgi:hypothetical protein
VRKRTDEAVTVESEAFAAGFRACMERLDAGGSAGGAGEVAESMWADTDAAIERAWLHWSTRPGADL